MRFHFQDDGGERITGWLAPDNPNAVGRVRVWADGHCLAEVAATITDPNIRALGWHATGQCHFEITPETVPDLATRRRLEIRDAETNVLIYRRGPDAGLARERLLLIETGIREDGAIRSALFRFFQQRCFGLSRLSDEVLRSQFGAERPRSCLMAGAILFPRYEGELLNTGTLTAILIGDPFEEMASRLLWLRARARFADDPRQRWRLGAWQDAAAFADRFDYADPRSLKRFFRAMPEPVYHLLYNPLTRQLGTRAPEERVQPARSIIALEILARIDIVGHRDAFAAFMTTLFDRLGIAAPVPIPGRPSAETLALAGRLRTLGLAREMIGFDEAISDGVRRAVGKSWAA